jgi:hypothetical protein
MQHSLIAGALGAWSSVSELFQVLELDWQGWSEPEKGFSSFVPSCL